MSAYRRSKSKASTPPGPKPAALLRYFKTQGRLMLAEHDGNLWVTEAYMAARLRGASVDRIGDLLRLYNLPMEAMVCEVGPTIVRSEKPPPALGGLFKGTVKDMAPMTRFLVGSAPVLVESSPLSEPLELWEADGRRLCLNPKIIGMANLLAPTGEWFAPKQDKRPLVKFDGSKPVAVAMSVRNLAVVAQEDAAA